MGILPLFCPRSMFEMVHRYQGERGDCKDKDFGHTLDTSSFGIYVGLILLKMSQMNSPMATGTAEILVED